MQEQEIHLRDYIRVIRKRRSTVLTFFSITFLVVVIGTLTAVPEYLASTKILVEKNEVNPLTKYYYYSVQDPEFVETQSQIIKSKRVARKVVRLLNLEQKYSSYFPEKSSGPGFIQTAGFMVKDSFKNIFGFLAADTASPPQPFQDESDPEKQYSPEEDRIAAIVSTGISVSPVKESKVFDISFMSRNPVLARQVVNTVAKAYMEELIEIKMHSSGYTIKWMTDKAGEERQKLEKSEKELQSYMQANDIITIEDRITIIPQKLSDFSTQLSRAEARRKEMEALYLQVTRVASSDPAALDTIPAIAASKTIQALREQIIQTEQKATELSKKYGPKHPNMIKVNSELQSLNAKKKDEVQQAVQSIKNEYDLTQVNEDNIRNLLSATKGEALNLNEKFVEYQILKREMESNRALYEALLSRLKEQDITEESQNVNVWIVEEAETPLSPATPKTTRNIMLALVLGLFGGIGLAFFIEYLDNTVKTPEEAEERLGLPMLGVIDRFPGKDKEMGLELFSLDQRRSGVAENFKAIRTSVLLSSTENPPKSIVVTSMLPGEGKTITAANLAVTIALAGQRVLLIDGDMRRPRLHRIFALDNRKGLSTYLAGGEAEDIIQQGPLEMLSVIAAGPQPPNPSELLSSGRLKTLVGDLELGFDIIIFDSAPIVSVTDTLIISKAVDSTLIVTRASQTTFDVIDKGVKNLREINSHILGMVINAFDIKKHRYYYGKDYYNSYGAYYGDDTKES